MTGETYDAVIIGAGNKALITAMYLAKYGGMTVALFESRHEAGGGWSTEQGAAPGFQGDLHCSAVSDTYHLPTERDFPEWMELGGKITNPEAYTGVIFKEDQSTIILQNTTVDPTQEKSARSIAKFSEKDAETWVKLEGRFRQHFAPAMLEFLHNPPPPPGEPDALERLWQNPEVGIDPAWLVYSPIQVLRDLFENDAFVAFLLKTTYSALACSPETPGMGLYVLLFTVNQVGGMGGVISGTHNWAHAASKIIQSHGGKIFTEQEVDKVIIENDRAKGIRLTDGTEVHARKLVLSTLDPSTLCFRLIGKEYLSSQILRRVANLDRRFACITWYTWALHELPDYQAARVDPDINRVIALNLIPKDPEAVTKETAMRKLNKIPEDLLLTTIAHSLVDKTRAPEGKYTVSTEQFALPANVLTEQEWLEYKKSHAEAVIKLWQEYAPNMTWDNVIGYQPRTPYDCCELANMAPTGNTGIIDRSSPDQLGRNRPIPELARHRTPIEGLYATGSAWHPHGQGACWQGYNCYKIIAEDLGLAKPWEGHPW